MNYRPWRLLLRGKRDRQRDPLAAEADRGSGLPLVVLVVLVIAAIVGSLVWRHSPPW